MSSHSGSVKRFQEKESPLVQRATRGSKGLCMSQCDWSTVSKESHMREFRKSQGQIG